ncbi:MAG: methyltransferase domain-containing protein [Actinomycetota bacterium]|nr:methyltransferase domain-containing protein [Actinomycetota bacterium]
MQREEHARIAAAEDEHWWYRHTRRVMAQMLGPWLQPDRRVLDAGCGPGGNTAWLSAYGSVVGADIAIEALHLLKTRWPAREAVQATILDLPFAPASFDIVVTVTVLMMLDDDARAVREVCRVLRPGGVAFFVEPAFPALRRSHDDVFSGRRRYRRPQFASLLQEAGLSVQRSTYAHAYLLVPAALLSMADRVRPSRDQPARSDLQRGHVLDPLFTGLTKVEGRLLARRNLPAGVSVVAVATRPG